MTSPVFRFSGQRLLEHTEQHATAGGHQEQDSKRTVSMGGSPTVARGDTSGYLVGGYIGASREIPIDDNWTTRLSGSFRYLHQGQEGYRDSEGLAVDDLSLDTLRFGPRAELLGHYVDAGGVTFRPRGHAGWTQQVALDEREVRLTLLSGASSDVALDDGDEGYVDVGVGLEVIFEGGPRACLGFDGAYGSAQTRSSAVAGLSIDLP